MKQISLLYVMTALMAPTIAVAHTEVGLAGGGWSGFAHPFVGADHMLAMLAVGLWAVQLGGRATWIVPAAFVVATMLGAGLVFAGVNTPSVEQGIAVSVLVLGLAIAASLRLPVLVSAWLVGIFALFHGLAHGMEMPVAVNAVAYVAGFALATALLHGSGIAVAMRLKQPCLLRWIGAVLAAGGTLLVIS